MSERFKLQHINDLTDQEYMRLKKITDNGELITLGEVVDLLNEQQAIIKSLKEENEKLRRLFEEMKQPITINLTEEDEKELRKLLGLIDDE